MKLALINATLIAALVFAAGYYTELEVQRRVEIERYLIMHSMPVCMSEQDAVDAEVDKVLNKLEAKK